MKKIALLLLVFILASAAIALHENWKSPPDAKINFTIDGMFGVDVEGTVSGFRSSIEFYPEDVSRSVIHASLRPATVNTGNNKRDAHLKTADFFDIEKYPEIRFNSKSFRKVGEYFVVEGDLTLKDVTKSITIPFEFIPKGDSATFNGDFTIKRLDYHLGKKSLFMGNEVRIHIKIPVAAK